MFSTVVRHCVWIPWLSQLLFVWPLISQAHVHAVQFSCLTLWIGTRVLCSICPWHHPVKLKHVWRWVTLQPSILVFCFANWSIRKSGYEYPWYTALLQRAPCYILHGILHHGCNVVNDPPFIAGQNLKPLGIACRRCFVAG